jgi:hypothetical protein
VIATDVVTVGVGLKGSLSTTEAAVASDLAQQGSNASKVKGVFAFLSEIKPVLKTGFNIAGFVLDEVLAKDPQDRNLLGASYNFLTQNPDTWTPPPLDGQIFWGVTMQTSTAFQTNEPTAGGAGGWGGGGGGGGVGGAGGFGGGRLIGQVLANRYRDDLQRAGLGSGRHGFEFAPPAGLAFTSGAIEVRRSLDGAALKFSTDALREGQLPPRHISMA